MCVFVQRSAERVHGDSEQILTELQRSLERLQELVEEVMDSRGQGKLKETQDVVEKLEAEVRELKRRDSEMRQLVACEDNIHFLQVNVLRDSQPASLKDATKPQYLLQCFPL